MLYTEISIPAEMKKKSGSVHLNQLKKTFHDVIERETSCFNGRVWIWNEYGGLVLFPAGSRDSAAVISGIKIMLNRVPISVEDFDLHFSITIRAAMHLGPTVYKSRGENGDDNLGFNQFNLSPGIKAYPA